MTSASLGHNTEETEYIEILSCTFQPQLRAFISTSLLPRLTFSRLKDYYVTARLYLGSSS